MCTNRITYNHQDRDEVKRRSEVDFFNLFDSLGCQRRGTRLHCPFHRDRTPSAHFNKYRRFFCFSCNSNLDVFEFVQRVLDTNFKSALTYLADRYGVALNQTTLSGQDKVEYAKRFRAAETEAQELVNWRAEMLAALRDARNVYLRAYHRFLRLILTCSLNHPRANFWADACETFETKHQDLDRRIDAVEQASFTQLLPLFRVRRGA